MVYKKVLTIPGGSQKTWIEEEQPRQLLKERGQTMINKEKQIELKIKQHEPTRHLECTHVLK